MDRRSNVCHWSSDCRRTRRTYGRGDKMMAFRSSRKRRRQSGHAIVEVAFLCPWILFLFAGTFDVGFCAYSLIATQNAARVAAQYASQGPTTAVDQSGTCTWALAELNTLPGAQ